MNPPRRRFRIGIINYAMNEHQHMAPRFKTKKKNSTKKNITQTRDKLNDAFPTPNFVSSLLRSSKFFCVFHIVDFLKHVNTNERKLFLTQNTKQITEKEVVKMTVCSEIRLSSVESLVKENYYSRAVFGFIW